MFHFITTSFAVFWAGKFGTMPMKAVANNEERAAAEYIYVCLPGQVNIKAGIFLRLHDK